jgi:thiamine-phosphate pyrophosphorylase
MKFAEKDLLLYAVTDRTWLRGDRFCDRVEASLRGGATFMQLREKELSREKFRAEALEIKELCRRYKVPFVLDDDAELAVETGADGVHVGQSDMEAGKVRQLLGPDKILGVSAQTVDEALLAERRGADYLGVGAVFPTGTKSDADDVSLDTLKAICAAVSIPVIAIGGITKENVAKLAGTGIVGVAAVSAIFAPRDSEMAARELKAAVKSALGR